MLSERGIFIVFVSVLDCLVVCGYYFLFEFHYKNKGVIWSNRCLDTSRFGYLSNLVD